MKKFLLVFSLALLLSGCSLSKNQTAGQNANTQSAAEQKVAANSPLTVDTGTVVDNLNKLTNTPEKMTNSRTVVLMKTSMGDIKIQLFDDLASKTVKNFLDLMNKKFYDGTLFHRVIENFMIQGGDPLTKSQPKDWEVHGTGGPGYTFADEPTTQKLVYGSLAMANSGPNTNGSQFFIVTAPATPWLDGSYNNFGMVLEGMDVAVKISKVKTNSNDHPLEDVKILSIEVVK